MDNESDLRAEVRRLREELDHLRTTLEVVGPVDVETGILNRTGILDALERGRHWLTRRGDIYGLVVVWFPDLPESLRSGSDGAEFRTHVAATLGAAVREVDSVGSVTTDTFAAVLADLNAGALPIVIERIRSLVDRLVAGNADVARAAIGGVEVLAPRSSGAVLETAADLARNAGPEPSIERLE